MADAAITLKVSPREFDLLRAELAHTFDNYMVKAEDKELPAETRRIARQRAGELSFFLERLK